MTIRCGVLQHRPRTVIAVIAVAGALISGCGTRQTNASVPIAQTRATAAASAESTPILTPVDGSTNVAENDTSAESEDTEASATTDVTSTTEREPATTARATTTSTSTTTTTTTTTTLPPTTDVPVAIDGFPATNAAFERLATANPAASISVVRGGERVVGAASGTTVDGSPATSDSPMVVASVSKIVVALAISRLADQDLLDVSAPFPWADVGLAPDAGWTDVTIRELLDHTGGVPKVQAEWFTGEGTCRDFVSSLLESPPSGDRGRWVYSNGNYCLLGLLIEERTGVALDDALQQLVFDPIGAHGVHQTVDGILPGDVPYVDGTARLSRLGGAGTLIVSTDDLAMALARMTPMDRWVLRPPGVFTDQYGFGHTGTVSGAKSCVWVLEGGATVVAATIAGNAVGTGGGICDIVVPAVASDLGLGSAKPDRIP